MAATLCYLLESRTCIQMNNITKGVTTEKGDKIVADIFVSNIDPRQTFFCLIERNAVEDDIPSQDLGSMKESVSFFLIIPWA